MKKTAKTLKQLISTLLVSGFLMLSPQTHAETSPPQTPTISSAEHSRVNINQADLEGLQLLKGVGPAKAQRIIDFRSQHGPFKSVEALTQVKGINLKLLEQNKGRIEI